MPYVLLILGLIIGVYALYRFFLKANVRQIKSLFLAALLLALCIALFYMAVTGRLIAAIALIPPLAPILWGIYKEWKHKDADSAPPAGDNEVKTVQQALEILGLEDGASEDDIQKAYKRLMQKIHPDNEGSEWMAAKLNQARDLLLKDR